MNSLVDRLYLIIFLLVFFILTLFSVDIQAGGIPTLDPVEITAKSDNIIGTATSSSEGTIKKMQLDTRPILRPGEVLEFVPGLIVTQHSSNGKANQFFLRGFNLDHGTDFLTTVGGMQINQRSHAHGQGYTDLNFLIPELLGSMRYKKGPYSAKEGDFSSAGAAYLDYVRVLPKAIAEYTAGRFNYHSILLAGSTEISNGNLLFGLK
jgi:outer membrane cobalamin receptor